MPSLRFIQEQPLFSIEGVAVIGMSIAAYHNRSWIFEKNKSHPHLVAGVTSALVIEVLRSFFAYANENRRRITESRVVKHKMALEEAKVYTDEAEAAIKAQRWIVAAKALHSAASIYEKTDNKCSTLQDRGYALYVQSAFYAVKGGNLKDALATLNQEDLSTLCPHHAQFHALRGVAYFKLQDYPKARADFQQSLKFDPQQENITLLYLFTEKNHKAIVEEYRVQCVESSSVRSVHIRADDFFDTAIYAYAESLSLENKPEKAIVILEALLPLAGPAEEVYIHQAIAQAYLAIKQTTTFNLVAIKVIKGQIEIEACGKARQLTPEVIATKQQLYADMAEQLKNRSLEIHSPKISARFFAESAPVAPEQPSAPISIQPDNTKHISLA